MEADERGAQGTQTRQEEGNGQEEGERVNVRNIRGKSLLERGG